MAKSVLTVLCLIAIICVKCLKNSDAASTTPVPAKDTEPVSVEAKSVPEITTKSTVAVEPPTSPSTKISDSFGPPEQPGLLIADKVPVMIVNESSTNPSTQTTSSSTSPTMPVAGETSASSPANTTLFKPPEQPGLLIAEKVPIVIVQETVNDTSTNPTSPTTTSTTPPPPTTIALSANANDLVLEFENGLSSTQIDKYLIYRSEASGNMTIHLQDADASKTFTAKLCVEGIGSDPVVIQVTGVYYSNDGPPDTIFLTLDGNPLGQGSTEEFSNGGAEWNVFKSTGPIGGAVALTNGNHTLSMTTNADQWGVELDYMTIRAQNQNPEVELLCESEFL